MPSFTRHRSLVVGIVALGVALRLVLLPLPGTIDVVTFKVWAFGASSRPLAFVYGKPENPAERTFLGYLGKYFTVDYPPLALVVFGLTGRAYRLLHPDFADGPALTVAVKLPAVIADVGLASILWLFARRRGASTRNAVLHWWLAPAVLLNGAALGYTDPLAALPLSLAFVAASSGSWGIAGALGAAAALIKAQAVIPGVALAWFAFMTGRRNVTRAAVPAACVTAAVVLPIAAMGAAPALVKAIGALTRHDMISAQAANVWWIFTWIIRAVYAAPDLGAWPAFTAPVRILAVSTLVDLGYASLKPVGTLLVLGATAWALWRASRFAPGRHAPVVPDAVPLWAVAAALGAFLVHAYYMLGIQVHENHLFLSIPLAVIAASAIPAYGAVAATLGWIQALNLFLFYGISDGIGWLPPRGITIVDATAVLALASTLVFAWHARVFIRITSPRVLLDGAELSPRGDSTVRG